jgi:flagellar basal-body rod modification protein FlgD
MPSAVSPVTTAGIQSTGAPSALLGKDDFLKMLIMQMRFQDPLEPMKGTEFAAQLAQFSSVEQLSNINTNLTQSIDATSILSQSINNALATTFIGKNVRAGVAKFQYAGTGDVQLGYSLTGNATSATIKIYNSSGTVVRTINGTGLSAGDNEFSWDGKDDSGNAVATGQYRFSIDAKGSDGKSVGVSPYMYGAVKGIRYKPEGTVFVIDGVEVALSDILEITER